MNRPAESRLPLEQWSADMQSAAAEISQIGARLLDAHSGASDTAAHIADQWKLSERLQDERAALDRAFETLHRILTAIDQTRHLQYREGENSPELLDSMRECTAAIENGLPALQHEFLTVRHCALDLLRWARRFANLPDSALPDEYRASYAQLLAYTPIFRPYLETLQHELVVQSRSAPLQPEVQKLLTALQHYSATVDSARGFIMSVVQPPMELIFHDTEAFQNDWKTIDPESQAHLATELNDCCQFLLYDLASFDGSVSAIHRKLSDELDAVLYALPVERWRIIFTKDEDPVFHQLVVTLLRVVPAETLDETAESLFDIMFRDFSDD